MIGGKSRKQRVVSAEQRVSERAHGIDRSHLNRHCQAHINGSEAATFFASYFANFTNTKWSPANEISVPPNGNDSRGFPNMYGCNETCRNMSIFNENSTFSVSNEVSKNHLKMCSSRFPIRTIHSCSQLALLDSRLRHPFLFHTKDPPQEILHPRQDLRI